MPLARTIARIACIGIVFLMAGCAVAEMARESEYARLPREIRTGAAEMVLERVGEDVSPDEVGAAVEAMVAAAPVCFPWPGVWLDASDRRAFYFVRYDLMERDWGEEVASSSRRRMQEFVDTGFLTARERPDIGVGVIEYNLTAEGELYLRGSPYGGERPSFCAPSQRRVIEITRMEWGQFPCGNLRVGFTHVGEAWPAWARSEGARARIVAMFGPLNSASEGSVSLSRQWFRPNALPPERSNGELRSVCYDTSRQRIIGDDLTLMPR